MCEPSESFSVGGARETCGPAYKQAEPDSLEYDLEAFREAARLLRTNPRGYWFDDSITRYHAYAARLEFMARELVGLRAENAGLRYILHSAYHATTLNEMDVIVDQAARRYGYDVVDDDAE